MKQQRNLSLTMQAYLTLKQRIIDLQLRPGEILLVQPLAKELGISRTPVREAMVRLEQEGFVEEAEGKKFRVSEITLKSVLEIHEIRELLELHAAKKAALNRTVAQLEPILQLAERMKQALKDGNQASFFEADMEFHARILHICDNQTLENLMFQLNEKIQRIRYLTTYVPLRLEETIGEHDAILDAILNRDGEAAQRAMKAHLDNVSKGVVHVFESGAAPLFQYSYLKR